MTTQMKSIQRRCLSFPLPSTAYSNHFNYYFLSVGWEYSIYGHDILAQEREQPAEETEDHAAAAYLERVMSMGASAHEMLQPAAAQEAMPTAGTIDADESVILHTELITQTP